MTSHILLVEDDQTIARNLSLLLNSEGFEVTHVFSQREALAVLNSQGSPGSSGSLGSPVAGKFDLALIDISLPDGNGFAVCTAVKSQADIPVIFLTASGDEASVVTGLNMGAADYITKPFRPMELIARIKAALRKSGSAASTFEIGSLVIDTASGVAKKQGKELFLSALEYRLLLVFLNNQGSIITRSRLLAELWETGGEYVNDNTLTVYIKRLREKIEENPADPRIILTVRGLGYKLGYKPGG